MKKTFRITLTCMSLALAISTGCSSSELILTESAPTGRFLRTGSSATVQLLALGKVFSSVLDLAIASAQQPMRAGTRFGGLSPEQALALENTQRAELGMAPVTGEQYQVYLSGLGGLPVTGTGSELGRLGMANPFATGLGAGTRYGGLTAEEAIALQAASKDDQRRTLREQLRRSTLDSGATILETGTQPSRSQLYSLYADPARFGTAIPSTRYGAVLPPYLTTAR